MKGFDALDTAVARDYNPSATELNDAVEDILLKDPDLGCEAVHVRLLGQYRTWNVTSRRVLKFAKRIRNYYHGHVVCLEETMTVGRFDLKERRRVLPPRQGSASSLGSKSSFQSFRTSISRFLDKKRRRRQERKKMKKNDCDDSLKSGSTWKSFVQNHLATLQKKKSREGKESEEQDPAHCIARTEGSSNKDSFFDGMSQPYYDANDREETKVNDEQFLIERYSYCDHDDHDVDYEMEEDEAEDDDSVACRAAIQQVLRQEQERQFRMDAETFLFDSGGDRRHHTQVQYLAHKTFSSSSSAGDPYFDDNDWQKPIGCSAAGLFVFGIKLW